MSRTLQQKREAMKPLGIHTVIGHLHECERWKDVPFLKANKGLLPPFIIAVGSRERVDAAQTVLQLRDAVMVDDFAKSIGIRRGRVSVLIGIFEKAGLQVPIAVVETQMGCPATQINMREALHYASNFGYMVGSTFVHSDGIYVIRAGTAGGVNDLKRTSPVVGIGDILIATKSYGAIGAVIQSTLGRLDFLNGASAMAETFAYDHPDIIGTVATGTLLTSKCSSRLVIALSSAANALGIAPITGPDFTKDSLYAELTEAGFALLRERYGIVSTEMEQLVIDVLAAEFRRAGLQVHSGLVSAAIGAIPGKSFPVTPAEKALAAQAEVHAMLIAANALADIALAANK